ncbi:MAG TPA: penicillin-binding protein 2 [Methylomusa anaerophila]|uniref:Stage V sporulation protein D n=1 Tax=Methylomusa anaerophila TaxID=1930071 RepID=A0A348AGR0_9FIRM|nr:penicillin-binding protein 2 [Methylomusa anaerophila]BBB90258.1 stage V sporulation protein D [Methylomusa anaerophila]HML89396.1 penicillin-binding protein 2 [Methylomusa anaerophila]
MWDERLRRMQIMTYIVLGVIVLLVVRLGWLQLVQGAQYKKIAEENRVRQVVTQAPRGTIYDRNGTVLVTNRPSFAISIIPAEYTSPEQETPLLAGIIGITTEKIETMIRQGEKFPYTPLRLKRDVDQVAIARVEERKRYLPGVIIEAVPVRHYVYKELAAHLCGFVGVISEEEYDQGKNMGYHPNDLVGKDGLEREWEKTLRGKNGGRRVEINASGEEVGALEDKPSIPGNAIVLTLDVNLQKAAEEALAAQVAASGKMGEPAKGGAVVVLDVRTGGVLAMASNPSFDPNVFAVGISNSNWEKIITNPNNPLTNRVIQSTYPPGSVFKIVTASAALNMGLTSREEIFEDKGVYVLNGWSFYGWETTGLGRLNIVDGIAWSSDPLFYELGRRLGADNLAAYALTFGLGNPTGIQLAGEEAGVVPSIEWKRANYGEEWYPGETLIAAIGQGYYLVTPLQQALLAMAVATGGVIHRPLLVDKTITPEGNVIQAYQPEIARTVYLRPEVWDTVRQGMRAVIEKGTAAAVFTGFPRAVAGKTGSAETGKGTTHSWFACYAPYENPEIAVAVLIDEGGEGSMAAAPVARHILEAYFGLQEQPLPPQPKTD